MSFAVDPLAYDRFMGRYSTLLAPQFVEFASVQKGDRALDVGCGPGSLTGELVRRLGGSVVAAIDPSPAFVAAASARYPDVEVLEAAAEDIPFPDDTFDVALAQLVVHFMKDPIRGIREMARVTRPRGVVAACVWDHAGGEGPLARFWDASRQLHGDIHDESLLAGAREGHLNEIFESAGLDNVRDSSLVVEVEYQNFEEWWEPFTLGVGPAGAFLVGLESNEQGELRDLCRQRYSDGPFVVTGLAWAARGQVPVRS